MSDLISFVTQAVLVLITLLTVVDYRRHGGTRRRDAALMFASLGVSIVIGWVQSLAGLDNRWIRAASSVVIVAHPYLLLQLVRHFRPVWRPIRWLALAGLPIIAALVCLFVPPLPGGVTLAIVVYFAAIEGYSGTVLIRGAFTTTGDPRRRLAYAAAGTVLLAIVFALAGVAAVVPALAGPITVATRGLAIAAALAYYVGFAPPGWIGDAWRGLRLGNQVLPLVVIATLIGVLGTTGMILQQVYNAWENQLRENQISVAALTANAVHETLVDSSRRVSLTASRPSLRQALATGAWDGPFVQQAIDDLAALNPTFQNAAILDNTGHIRAIATSDKSVLGRDVSDREYFQTVLRTGQAVISDPFPATNPPRPTIAVAVPVTGSGGQTLGLVVVALDLVRLSQQLQVTGLADETRIVLISPDGKIAVHPDSARLLQPAESESPWAAARRGQTGTTLERPPDAGSDRLIAYQPVPELDWHVVVSTPTGVIFRPLQTAATRAGLVALLLLVIIGAASAALTGFLFRPLHSLSQAVDRFASGDYSTRVVVRGAADVRALADRFNDMAEAVEGRTTALRESEERTRSIIETSLDAFVATDELGQITDWSARAESLFGWLRDEAIGQEFADLILPEDVRAGYRQRRAEFQSGGAGLRLNQTLTVSAVRRDGREVPIEISSWPLRTAGTVSIYAFIRDISERRRAEAALAAVNRQNALILASAGEGIYGLDRAGRTTFINPAAARLFGRAPADCLGQRMHDLTHHSRADGQAYPLEECPISDAYRSGITRRIDNEVFWRPDGTSFTVDYSSTPIHDERGDLVGAVVTFQDSTERQALVRQLQIQNADLEAASRHKSEFLANMSHELRTPLNAINGFSQLILLSEADELDEPTMRSYVQTINDSGQHLLQLINDILDLAKVEAGKLELRPEELDLANLVGRVIATVAPLATKKNVTLVDETAEAGHLVADEGKVKQILYNLLSNAIKFTPDGGAVAVLAERQAEFVQVTVADTGIGIAPEDQAKIFREFQQLDAGADRRYEGTGLGLALTQRLIELHGGRIWLESAVGQGSQFHFTLPIHRASVELLSGPPEPVAVPPAAAAPESDGRPTILVVDDDPQSARLLAVYLDRGGYHVVVATNGPAALELARSLRPVAITLDIMMPRMDGWEVLQALKEDPQTAPIPVVIASIVDEREFGYALGAADYLVKPVDPDLLLGYLGRLTGTRPAETRVLIVDDDPQAIDLLAGMLTPAGYQVLRADGGRAGIELARQARPEVMLLDLMMPDVSGFEVLEAVRADPLMGRLAVLIVTAKDLTAAERDQLTGHTAAILRKGSLARDELLDRLNEMTRQSRRPTIVRVEHGNGRSEPINDSHRRG